MRLREVDHLRRQVTIDAAISQALSGLPVLAAARNGSVPDDYGTAGYSADDEDGVLTYAGWFGAGDEAGEKLVRPY